MPRKSPAVPKYRHHKPSGQAFVQFKGHRHYLGVFGSPRSRERYAAFLAELGLNPDPRASASTDNGLTLVEVCLRWLQHAEQYYRKGGSPTDHMGACKRAVRYCRELYGDTPAAEFGPLRFRAVIAKIVDDGLARSTINQTIGVIKRMLRWAASHELIPEQVHRAVSTVEGLRRGKTAARETAPIQPVEDAVVEDTLPFLNDVGRDMVQFQRLTGCRPGEVCSLRPADVDRSNEVWVYVPTEHKTEHHGRRRVIYVGPKAQEVLRPYLLRPAEAYCFSPAESAEKAREARRAARKTPLSCGNRPGKNRKRKPKRQARNRYDKNAYRQAIVRAVKRANRARKKENQAALPHWSPNQLRHAAATEIRREFGLEAAQIILGHARADVTQVYAGRDSRVGVEVAKRRNVSTPGHGFFWLSPFPRSRELQLAIDE